MDCVIIVELRNRSLFSTELSHDELRLFALKIIDTAGIFPVGEIISELLVDSAILPIALRVSEPQKRCLVVSLNFYGFSAKLLHKEDSCSISSVCPVSNSGE
jgi:hypothetical protein